MKRAALTGTVACVIGGLLSACGVYTPDKDPFRSDAIDPNTHWTSQGRFEDLLVNHIVCEIGKGLDDVDRNLHLPWIKEWGTTVTQTVTVEDQTGVSPGISAISPLQNGLLVFPAANGGNVVLPQSFSFNVGGTASANGLRTETIQYTFRNRDIIRLHQPDCIAGKKVMIDGDLKIREFIYDKAFVASGHVIQISDSNPIGSAYNIFTEEITFIASYGASATPTWHLARISANASSNLIVAQRTNTNDLVITLGPIKCPLARTDLEKKLKFTDIPFSQFLADVDNDRVTKVLMEGNELRAVLKNGALVQTYAPADPNLVQRLYERKILIKAGPARQCPKDGPVELIDSAMSQHQARVAANAIAVSVTAQTH